MKEQSFDTFVDDPGFLKKAFSFAADQRKQRRKLDPDNITRIAEEEWDELSREADKTELQESFSIRNILKAKRIANLLIDEKGNIHQDVLNKFIAVFSKNTFFLGKDRHHDHKRNRHILRCLQTLDESKEIKAALLQIPKPSMHKGADEIIKRTLGLPFNTVLTDAHARRAALSSWLAYLRQAVGSCFATAPAIVVHDEQPLQYFKDISELFSTGKLKRTFSGTEYTVPLCVSSGKGGLIKPLLITKDIEEAAIELSSSPSLLSAIEGSGILGPESEATPEKLYPLILGALRQENHGSFGIITSPESLIRKMLLTHFNVSEENIKEYEAKPQGMILGSLMMQATPKAGSGKGKGDAISAFLTAFEGAKWGFKSLAENALLRVWEYTLASFAETKSEFSRWNLYSSLGFSANEEGGIGECLYQYLQTKLTLLNREVENYQIEYETLFTHIKTLESRMRHVASEDEAKWLRIEYQGRSNEMNTVLELRDKAHGRSKRCASMFDLLIGHYIDLFPNYFQEVYDPEIGGIAASIYDDTPAGFRLLYKHGRTNSSLWTYIHNPSEFIDCLVSFFVAVERELAHEPDFTGAEQDLTEITSAIVAHIRGEHFLETAFFRMAKAHGARCPEKPLEHLDLVEKKPWIYTSGGNFITLTSVYFSRDEKPTVIKRWVENPMELLVFLADNLKKVPYKLIDEYVKDPSKSFLIHSPTHAFLLKPGLNMFKKAWNTEEFTFTWIRDQLLLPQERFIDNILLNSDMMAFFARRFSEKLSPHHRHLFLRKFGDIRGSMTIRDFRHHIIMGMDKDPGLMIDRHEVLKPNTIDTILFEDLPLFPVYKLKERVEHVLERINGLSNEEKGEALRLLDHLTASVSRESVMGAKQLFEIVSGLILLSTKKTSFEQNLQLMIKEIMESEGYSFPAPIVFADTNWARDMFAFVVNPGTSKLELWRTDDLCLTGESMVYWKMWLDGSRKEPDWGVLVNPIEYKAATTLSPFKKSPMMRLL